MDKKLRYVLISFFVWVTINCILYLVNIEYSSWQDFFLIKDKPIIIAILLVGFIVLYFLHSKMNNISNITEKTIYVSLFFYIIFFILSSLYTKLTDYHFKSDWTIIILSFVPLIILIILILLEKDFFRAKLFGKVELEFGRIFNTSTNQRFYLEKDYISKGNEKNLHGIIKNIQETEKNYKVLIVNIDDNIDFMILRKYIYKISEVSPLEYIVFLEDSGKYLGFLTVNDYKSKFPKYSLEYLSDDLKENDEIHLAERLSGFMNELEILYDSILRSYWDGNRIRKRDLYKFGIKKAYLEEANVRKAYKTMIENNVPGVPVLNKNKEFEGIVTKENILNELILEILGE